MKLTVVIHMDNAAFEDDSEEAARILADAGDKISRHLAICRGYSLPDIQETYMPLRDINGNTVGSLSLEK